MTKNNETKKKKNKKKKETKQSRLRLRNMVVQILYIKRSYFIVEIYRGKKKQAKLGQCKNTLRPERDKIYH